MISSDKLILFYFFGLQCFLLVISWWNCISFFLETQSRLCHQTWLEHPRTKWRLLSKIDGNIIGNTRWYIKYCIYLNHLVFKTFRIKYHIYIYIWNIIKFNKSCIFLIIKLNSKWWIILQATFDDIISRLSMISRRVKGEVSEANYLHTKKEISGELQGRCQAI